MASMDVEIGKNIEGDDEEISPIEEVRATVSNTDDPSLPVWTFRMWFLGIISCVLLSFVNQFFAYRSEPMTVTQIVIQIVSLPLGRFMASALPTKKFHLPGFGSRDFSLNPGPFNIKEHVLISIFANAGAAFGGGEAYAVGIVTIVKAFYRRKITFFSSWLLVITTQILGYGWAGVMRKYVVEPAQMWWPGTMAQVSLFRALNEKKGKDTKGLSRGKFFAIAFVCSFAWALFPLHFMSLLSTFSIICWLAPKSVTLQQIGSGNSGLGIGSFSLDWAVATSYLGSPLISPFFATMNVLVGFILTIYLVIPVSYWVINLYDAKTYPIFSSGLFTSQGQAYNITAIVNNEFKLDMGNYEKQGPINLSMFFSLSYGLGFAAFGAILTHVALFHGREIYQRFKASYKGKDDIHTRLMRKYKDIPDWWFYLLLAVTLSASLALCIFLNDQVQMPWWGLLLACAIALLFTLPISIITAISNQTPGLNIITEYVMGVMQPGRPVSNVVFKTFGYISMSQAVSFLSDFKLGHYMKIPPRSMFLVQFIGTLIAGTVNICVAWWMLNTIPNICEPDLLPPNSPWTCPNDAVFFDASVIWGLAGPIRMFGPTGKYSAQNWFFLGGAIGPVIVYGFHRLFPTQSWIPKINLPILLGATAMMPPAASLNYTTWILVALVFNGYIYKCHHEWWKRYNYVLSAGLEAGVAILGVLHFFATPKLDWWGTNVGECALAQCPTATGVVVDGCPVF